MTFEMLWDSSPMFQTLFFGNGRPFPHRGKFDKEKAIALWSARYPKIEWGVCGYGGCNILVKAGECCNKHHYVSGEMATWAWVNKVLYRYLSFQRGAQKTINDKEYKPYLKHIAALKFGGVPHGYRVFQKDGNVFNCNADNLILLSKYSYYLVENRLLAFEDAIEIDMRIGKLLHEKMKAGRRPFSAVFGYGDISRVSGIRMTTIRKEVERGNVDPSNLGSIVEFVNKHKNGDNEEVNG